MVQLRWSLTVAALALGVLGMVNVHHGPVVHGAQRKLVSQGTVPQAALKNPATPADIVEVSPRPGPAPQGACPSDMVEIEGAYCPAPEQICDEYISEKRDRCERFRLKVRCIGTPEAKHYCIDRYEYPNEVGHRPTVAVTWDEARDVCANESKRLCVAEEWTLACEGPERKPYPFGYSRDATACNFDKPYIMPDNFAYDDPQTRAAEVSRVNQSEPSGSRPRCASDYGVYDMTGNVDEWVVNEHGSPQGPEFQSGLKGGYWGPVRNRCRPMTTDHNHWHHGYQIGFRCCKDVDEPSAAPPMGEGNGNNDTSNPKAWSSPEATEPSRS